jgi:hypothetical protein
MGDYWEHTILVEKLLSADPKTQYPLCLKGKRACPPEDCGGIWGYGSFLETITDPNHPDHEGARHSLTEEITSSCSLR